MIMMSIEGVASVRCGAAGLQKSGGDESAAVVTVDKGKLASFDETLMQLFISLCEAHPELSPLAIIAMIAPIPSFAPADFKPGQTHCITRDPRAYIAKDRVMYPLKPGEDPSMLYRDGAGKKRCSNYFEAFADSEKLKRHLASYHALKYYQDENGAVYDMAAKNDICQGHTTIYKGVEISFVNLQGMERQPYVKNADNFGEVQYELFKARRAVLESFLASTKRPGTPPSSMPPHFVPATPTSGVSHVHPGGATMPHHVVPPTPTPASGAHPQPALQSDLSVLVGVVGSLTGSVQQVNGNVAQNASDIGQLTQQVGKVVETQAAHGHRLGMVESEVSSVSHRMGSMNVEVNGMQDTLQNIQNDVSLLMEMRGLSVNEDDEGMEEEVSEDVKMGSTEESAATPSKWRSFFSASPGNPLKFQMGWAEKVEKDHRTEFQKKQEARRERISKTPTPRRRKN